MVFSHLLFVFQGAREESQPAIRCLELECITVITGWFLKQVGGLDLTLAPRDGLLCFGSLVS